VVQGFRQPLYGDPTQTGQSHLRNRQKNVNSL